MSRVFRPKPTDQPRPTPKTIGPAASPATPCPVCGEKNGNRHATTLSIVKIERVNPARYTYGALVDRAAVDAHLRALGVIA